MKTRIYAAPAVKGLTYLALYSLSSSVMLPIILGLYAYSEFSHDHLQNTLYKRYFVCHIKLACFLHIFGGHVSTEIRCIGSLCKYILISVRCLIACN